MRNSDPRTFASMGRPAQPEELAPAYVFLASDADSSYITGIVLQVMGARRPAAESFGPPALQRRHAATCAALFLARRTARARKPLEEEVVSML